MGWSPQIHAGFHGPGVTWDDKRRLRTFRIRGCYPLWPAFPESFSYTATCNSVIDLMLISWSHYPAPATPSGLALARFGLYPFRSPLLRVSRLLSFPRGTEMFQFPRFPPTGPMCSGRGNTP